MPERQHDKQQVPRGPGFLRARARDNVKMLQQGGHIPKDLEGLGRACLQMEIGDLKALYQRFPELDPNQNTDPRDAAKHWKKWMKSSASEPYRIQPRGRL